MEVREPSPEYLTKPAYKQTEVGLIPEDWDVHCLGNLTEPARPISYGIVQTGPDVPNGVRCLRVLDLDDGRINKANLITTTKEISAAYKRTILKAGDLVMPLRGKVGEVGLIDADLAGSNLTRGLALIAIRSDWSAQFCRQIVASPTSRGRLERAMNGSALQELPIATLRAFRIPVPPTKAEQEAIAEALSDADALIESLEQLLAKKRHLKQGAMQELLTGKRRLPGFSGEWEAADFGDIAVIRNAKVSASSTAAGTQCVELESIGQGTGRLLGSVAAQGPSSKYSFKKGDVLFGRLRAYLRKYWLATFDGICSTEIWPLIPRDDRLLVGFLHLLVHTSEFVDAAGVSYGTHMPRSDWSVLRKFPVQLPSRPEQIAIAAILADMDTELAALESKLTKARQIKQGMMQELLTGRIRLV